ncbi:conjugal transfer protein MobB [Chryseobacterium sp. MMS23-Vi53]|uniref:conjugal transfer protein MobB n=1 Tax=Chryseobacterium sp. MMS23-Vi53 TaxID=3386644 RepID=UPI0039E7CB01
MVAKIGRSSNLYGTLSYNNNKVEQDKGEILMTHKIIETANGKYTVSQLAKSFEHYLIANRNTEKHTLHISLNPHPEDQMSDEKYREIAQQYMNEMGYGNQPFVVFKHTDIDRSHIHIVSVCVDENGKKISDKFEKIRSMKVCRELENRFGLVAAPEKKAVEAKGIFKPVNYKRGDCKSQMTAVIRHLSDYYQFQSLGEYNALLSLFNITSEKIVGKLHGEQQRGLLYFPLNSDGKKVGHPFKSSLFGKSAGIDALEKQFEKSKEKMRKSPVKDVLRSNIISAQHSTKNEQNFKQLLAKQHINTVVRKNDEGRMYGITFIDHHTKTVWNGSRLGKELSSNVFHEKWNDHKSGEKDNPNMHYASAHFKDKKHDLIFEKINHFLNMVGFDTGGIIESFGGFIPQVQTEDEQEIDFINQMRVRRKRKRR